ncbi:MAG TPA: HAMP domain-containing sensor histidine kinase [Candidatus Dormibacteraeota bacterium]|jgi:two-component system OmpR family sensor kinase|nr:HAMP domain-containing sensor histidine kinase [Candidatus Dormibacteraeota bacterium]
MSLRRRLLLTLAPLFIIGLIAVDAATFLSLQSYLVSKADAQLLAVHPSVEMYLTSGGFGDGGHGGPQPSAQDIPTGTFGEILSASGSVIAGPHTFGPSGSALSSAPVLPAALKASSEQNPEYSTVEGRGGVDHYLVYVDNASQNGALLVTAVPLDDMTSTLNQLLLLEVLTTAAITIVVLVATWLIVRRGLRPLERMGTMARAAATDLSRRVEPADNVTEVGQLGIAVNTMLSQLETAFAERAASEQRLRHFVSDASHELRTPLTSMRGYAELLRRNPEMTEPDVALATRRIEDEAARMGILVDDLLLLARLDQGRPLERVPVDLGALVTDACADARATDPTRPITSRIDSPAQVIGDEMRLRQVLGNVVRNALVHTPPATPLEITLGAGGASAIIEVVDHGPGIPPENAQRIFERFQRVDPERSRDQGGSGLGLSIVAAVVAAHGGSIRVQQTAGGGATFRIELPLMVASGAPPTAASPPSGNPPAHRPPGQR